MARRNRRRRLETVPVRDPRAEDDSPIVLSWQGQSFRVAKKLGIMPMLTFAKLAQSGVDTFDPGALTAMYDMLENVIDPVDWEKFTAHATKVRADPDDLLAVVGQAMTALSGFPTSRPSDSSDGSQTTPQSSEDVLHSRVVERLSGRPDLQLVAVQAREARAG